MAIEDFILNDEGQIDFGDGTEGLLLTHLLTPHGSHTPAPTIGVGIQDFNFRIMPTESFLNTLINASLSQELEITSSELTAFMFNNSTLSAVVQVNP